MHAIELDIPVMDTLGHFYHDTDIVLRKMVRSVFVSSDPAVWNQTSYTFNKNYIAAFENAALKFENPCDIIRNNFEYLLE